MLRKLLAAVVTVLLAAGVFADPATAAPIDDETRFLSALNDLRRSAGVAPLVVHPRLTEMGRAWSLHMALADGISHNPDLVAWAPPEWTRLGENVGRGPTVASLHAALVASPLHHRNLVDPRFQYVGIGVVHDDGLIYVTQQFMTTAGATVTFEPAPEPAPLAKSAPGNVDDSTEEVRRIAGQDRISTSIAASGAAFTGHSARAAVLASHSSFADALAGTPLAAVENGPLLLTGGDQLDGRVSAELTRVLLPGSTVYVLGGTTAVGPAVEDAVRALGFSPLRLGGATRFATAVAIAEKGLGSPQTVLLATGHDFADALSGGAAAASAGGAVLLTDGERLPAETAAYLGAHPGARRFALGGPAAKADPSAAPIVGGDRFETSAKVAAAFFPAPTQVGAASGLSFADALSGGAHMATRRAPMVLVTPDSVPAPVSEYLVANSGTLVGGWVHGGMAVVSTPVVTALDAAI